MATVSDVTIKYAARGAKSARKADEKVRGSIKQTAKTARQETGTINRWMQRHKAALIGIGAAAAGAMAAIISNTPVLKAELAGVRLGFSLLAMQIGQDLAPAFEGAGNAALDLAEDYSNLPDAIRKPISAIIGFTLAIGTLAGLLAGLQMLFSGTFVATLAGKAVGAIVGSTVAVFAFAAAVGLIIGLIGVWILKVTGVLDWVGRLGSALGSILGPEITDLALTIGTLLTGGMLPLIAAFGAFITGVLEGGFPEGVRRAKKVLSIFGDAISNTISNALSWGSDFIDKFLQGIKNKIGDVESLASDIKDSVAGALGFDIVQNDRMARQWGSDLVQEFASGMQAEQRTLRRQAGATRSMVGGGMRRTPPGAGGAGGGGGQPPIIVRFERGAINQRGRGERPEVNERNVTQEQGSAINARTNI